MKQLPTTIFIFILFLGEAYGQNDTGTAYKHLKTKKYYAVDLAFESDSGEACYGINDKRVSRKTYRRYEKTTKNLENCCPCILKSYNENNILVREAVSCMDCGVGFFKDYYPNGQIKLIGQYKENPTGNWDYLWERGYCSVPDGRWLYYNENGTIHYSEYWKDGNFIQQVPEQHKTEIWKVELTIDGENASSKSLLPSQLKDLTITPRFKNSTTDSVNLRIEFAVSAIGRKVLRQRFTPDSFKMFDVTTLLLQNGYKAQDKIHYTLRILNNETSIAYFRLHVSVALPDLTIATLNEVDSNRTITRNEDFYLVNSMDSTKKVKLIPKIAYELNYSESPADTVIQHKTITYQGYLINLRQTSVNFDLLSENTYLIFKNGSESRTTNDYVGTYYSSYCNPINIGLKNLNSITYTSPSRDFFRTFGYAVTVLSVLTTTIVAPLVSINYKSGNFNTDRYFKFASGGLIGLSVGIPIIVVSKPKTYLMTYKNMNIGKDRWFIQSEIKQ